jgi:hypothetical protein
MVESARNKYNADFTKEKYDAYINELNNIYPGQLDFRIAETPVFVPKDFTEKVLSACESIVDIITEPSYLQASGKAIPPHLNIPGQDAHPHFIAFDFGICTNANGDVEPQLI